MGFFDFLRGDARDTAQPELSVQSVGGLSDKVAGNPTTNRDMLLAQLLQQEKLLNKANQDFKKEEDRVNSLPPPQNQEDYITRNSKLASIRENMTNYQNKIRDLLRDNNVSPNNLPDIYNFYVDGREVADENYSSQRENALSQYLNDPDAFNKEPNLPTASQMEEEYSNRRRNKLDDDLEVTDLDSGKKQDPETGETIDEADKNLERWEKRQGVDEGDKNLERREKRQSGDPDLLDDYDNQQLKAYKDDLTEQLKNDPKNQAIKDELGAIQNKQNERAEDLQQALTAKPPAKQTEIVATTGQSTTTPDVTALAHTNTIIHDVKEIHPPDEHTVFRSALSGLSIALVEYVKKLDPNVEIALNMMETVGYQLPDVINGAVRNVVSQISQISHMDTAGMRGSKNNRIKLRLVGEEHKMLKNAVFYPFIIIAIKFYSITKQINLDLNYFTGVALSQVLKKYLNLPTSYIDYAISLLQNFPNELGEAYLNNRNEVVGITRSQSMAIEKYIEFIKIEYKNYFNEDFMSAVKKTEHGTSTLPEVLNHLDNPKMLNLVYSVMMTIDNFILSVQNNDNVLLGLMGLVYAEASQSGDLVDANIISNSNVLGYVYFEGSMPMMGRKDIELEALRQMSRPRDERRLEGLNFIENNEKVAMWEDNMGNAIVTIRGTDHKDSGDIIDNFLNFGGSKEAYKTRRHNVARRLINEKLDNIDQTGRGSLKVLGYSLGGATAMRLGLEYPNLKIKVYNPVVSNSELQKQLFRDLKKFNSNIEFFYVDEDPISVNLKDYRNDFKMTMVKKNKFFSSHSLNNYI